MPSGGEEGAAVARLLEALEALALSELALALCNEADD